MESSLNLLLLWGGGIIPPSFAVGRSGVDQMCHCLWWRDFLHRLSFWIITIAGVLLSCCWFSFSFGSAATRGSICGASFCEDLALPSCSFYELRIPQTTSECNYCQWHQKRNKKERKKERKKDLKTYGRWQTYALQRVPLPSGPLRHSGVWETPQLRQLRPETCPLLWYGLTLFFPCANNSNMSADMLQYIWSLRLEPYIDSLCCFLWKAVKERGWWFFFVWGRNGRWGLQGRRNWRGGEGRSPWRVLHWRWNSRHHSDTRWKRTVTPLMHSTTISAHEQKDTFSC